MSPANRRKCQVPGCNSGEGGEPYTTFEGLATQDSVLRDLELHVTMVHASNKSTGRHAGEESRPEKFPRPEICEPASDTDWGYFLASWQSYKRSTKIDGQIACDQLWHCPSDTLKKKVYDSGVRPTDSEEAILAGIKRLCVKAHNNMVNILHFQELYQGKDQSVSEFAANLNGAAGICDFTVTCECSKEISYSEKMQAFQLVRGIYDTEIQEKLLAEAASKNLSLSDLVKLSEAIESGKRSSGVLTKSGGINKLSLTKKLNNNSNKRKCAYCGDAWHQGQNWRKLCKGLSSTCRNCNKYGHLAAVCRNVKEPKEANSLEESNPETPSPPQEGETASMGFLYQLTGEVVTLSHVGVNRFGKWARMKVDEHPEVEITIQADISGYEDLNLKSLAPATNHPTKQQALVDTGAQMVVIDLNTVYAMGLNKKNLIPVGMKIKVANTGGMKLLGGVLVEIKGLDMNGTQR